MTDYRGIEPSPGVDGESELDCHNCGQLHTDWEAAGTEHVDKAAHSGVVQKIRCGYCDAIIRLPKL